MDFTFNEYYQILEELKKDFVFESFENFSVKSKIYLRHDLDIMIENIPIMAKVEADMGVHSIFFFQPNNPFYNPLSSDCLSILKKVNDLGHSLGLHIDPSQYESIDQFIDLINTMQRYYSLFLPIDNIVSFHKPPTFILDKDIQIPGIINTYGNSFFKEIRYFSDSNRRSFKEQLFQSIEEDNKTSIQLVVHPYWWDHNPLNLWELYNRFLKIKETSFQGFFRTSFKIYRIFFDDKFK